MSYLFKELREMKIKQLIEEHDRIAPSAQWVVGNYLGEIHRRDQEMQTKVMLRYTKWICAFTIIMTLSAFVNMIFFLLH